MYVIEQLFLYRSRRIFVPVWKSKNMNHTLVVIVGPTGIGKTKTAIEVARRFNTEIISADSRQLYREMSVGTAVPSEAELLLAKHHFVHILSVHDYYNASRFEEEALARLEQLFQQYPLVVMAGGSMLYIDALCKGIDDLPTVDPEIRRQLIEKFEKEGIESLRFELKRVDPAYYAQVDLKNPKRLLHSLEISLMTGKPYSQLRTNPNKQRPFHILKIGLNTDRARLHERINQRVEQMVEAGLEQEARTLYPFRSANALNTVGYREWFDYFDGKTDRQSAIELIKRNTRQYARKQLTWFRRDPEINWFDTENCSQIIPFIETKISEYESAR